ncbi:hypothetical protein SK128_007611 [Halocaridina rubra]|uniref:Uncharacterized protein n=1 Tax=Halocaridina rubra TaxID=373956 RepID=A0AAN9ACT9_HALRR
MKWYSCHTPQDRKKRIQEVKISENELGEDALRNTCHYFNKLLPLNVRTRILNEVVLLQNIKEPRHAVSFTLLQLLVDATNFVFRAELNNGNNLELEHEDCEVLIRGFQSMETFHFEFLQLVGVSMDEGTLSNVLRKSPTIHSIHVSGEISTGHLGYLEEHP